MKKYQPPKWADRFLEWYCSSQFLEEVQGDLHEWYKRRALRSGVFKARLLYPFDVIAYMRLFRVKNLNEMERNNNILFFSYLKTALRQIKNNKVYTFMNITGLAFGLVSTLLIALYIMDELSFDRFHKDYQNVYRLINHNPATGVMRDGTPSPWKQNMELAFPQIESHTRLGQDVVLIENQESNVLEHGFYWTDDNFLEFFDFALIQGDRNSVLDEPNSIVLTRSKAMRYFGRTDVVGELMPIKVYDGNKEFVMNVTGVLEDIPGNSHLQFDFLGSMSTTNEMYGHFNRIWGLNWMQAYVRLAEGVDAQEIEDQMPQFFEDYRQEGASEYSNVIFQPLKDVRLYSDQVLGKLAKGNRNSILLFGFVAVLILLAASMNYVNLTTAKSSRRGREVGIRKVFGAVRRQVIRQFYMECAVLLLIAFGIAIALAVAMLPTFNAVVDKQMQASDLFSTEIMVMMLVMFAIVLGLSGFYPAVVMNRFKPVQVLKGDVSSKGGKPWIRNVQVLVQFSIAVFLISSTTIVVNQMRLFNNFDKGFNANQLINIPVDDRELQKRLMGIKDQMARIPGVASISATGEALPSAMNNSWRFDWEGKQDEGLENIHIVAIDYDYLKTLESDLVLGRNLLPEMPSDSSQVCLLNVAAYERTGWDGLDNNKVSLGGNDRLVVGVVENFNYSSLHDKVAPVAYLIFGPGARVSPDNLVLRLEESRISETLDELDKIWRAHSSQPFDFSFVDQGFAQLYGDEQRFTQTIVAFTTVGIVIGVLGLIGLISFVAQRKSKEISIRKVLGAGRMNILIDVGRQFIVIFLLSVIIALPLSGLAMGEWLKNFSYTTALDWKIFAFSGIVAMVIALFSVGLQALKITSTNPTKYLSDH